MLELTLDACVHTHVCECVCEQCDNKNDGIVTTIAGGGAAAAAAASLKSMT